MNSSTDFFRYLQLRSFLTKHKEWNKVLHPSPVEKILVKIQQGKIVSKTISHFYQAFSTMSAYNTSNIKLRWESEINTHISDPLWEDMCTEAHMVTNSNSWREFKWKVITRFFRTPEIVAKMNPVNLDICWRNCGSQVGNHTHIFWSCPIISSFWDDVFAALNTILHHSLPKDPQLAILGAIPDSFVGNSKKYVLLFC